MDLSLIFQFLYGVNANNNRTWFNEHRGLYEAARAEFMRLLTLLIARIAEFDDRVRGIDPEKSVFRIYRDIRFSPDKRPYKGYLGAYINPWGKNAMHGGYYFHLEPDNSMVAGGVYCPTPALLKALRQAVADNIAEFREIVEDPAFTRFYTEIGESAVKTAPKGFSKDYPYLQYIRCKDYSVLHTYPDDFFLQGNWLEEVLEGFRQVKRFNDFLNYTVDDFEETGGML
ncbi:MAG: DUF2461 domain-containing protein [Prevotellaceae bacterium]|nr:DUF2461 domain-containing protein [Prevotellaceae bacterium]